LLHCLFFITFDEQNQTSMLQVNQLSFSYQHKPVLTDLSFSLETGKSLAIIGESGCGKSTLLRLVYGLLDADSGTVLWNGQSVTGPKFNLIPGMDSMKYLPQDFDLMPYVTVAENVGKFLSNIYAQEKKKRVDELLELVEMSEFAHTKAKFLSGGQMQRVALARVLALEPELVLFDEPFSHIDNFRKNHLRRRIFSYLKQRNISCMIATHDRADILGYTDQTLVIKDAQMLALGSSEEVFKKPVNQYVASLYEEVSLLPAEALGLAIQDKSEILVYPFQLRVVTQSLCPVRVVQSYFRGHVYLVEAHFFDRTIFFEHPTFLAAQTTVYLQYVV
jgi:ABC-type Fe3+/spermidine/putrescine transport system ATPase subunit